MRSVLLAILLAVVLSAAVRAEERSQKQNRQYGSMRLGPLYLSVSIRATAGYDTNVYNTPSPLGDQAATVMPSIQAVLPLTRRARLRATGGILPEYFHTQASERHTDLFGTLIGEVDLGPFTVWGGLGRGRYRQRFSLEIDERLERHEALETFGGRLHVGSRVTVTGTQTNVTYTFDPAAEFEGQPVSLTLDRKSVTRRAEVSIPVTRKTSFEPYVEQVEDRFTHPQPGLDGSTKSERYVGAFAFSELAFFNGRFAAGVRRFGPGQGVVPYSGLYLSVDLGMPFVVHSRLLLSATRDVTYSASPPSERTQTRDTYVNSAYRAEVSFNAPLKLIVRPFAAYAEAAYLVPPDRISTPARKDHSVTFGGALLRRLGDHVNVGISAQKITRRSPIAERQYDGVVYGLTAEAHF